MIKRLLAALGLLALAGCSLSPPDSRDSVVMIDDKCSGFMVADKLVATAAHCLELGEKTAITTRDGRKFQGITIHSDASTDTALVYLDKSPKLAYTPLACGYEPRVGDRITVIGHPAFVFPWFVSKGFVAGDGQLPNFPHHFIWLDASIVGGNSGGPVFVNGYVVGITSVALSTTHGGAVHIKHLCKVLNG